MAKPLQYPQLVLFRATHAEHDYIKEEAEKFDISMAEVIRQCIALRKNSPQVNKAK